MAKTNGEQRFNFIFPAGVVRDLDAIQKQTDAASATEVVRRAVKLQRAIMLQQKRGGEIVVRDAKGNERVLVVA